MIQERTIFRITRGLDWPVASPIPKSEPTETCVVETGKPKRLAAMTKMPVARLAENPWP